MIAPILIWILTATAWASAVILVRAARIPPRIGSLTERATVAVGIALFGTAYSLAVFNNEVARFLEGQTVLFIVRLAVVVLLLLPLWWVFVYLTGRIGRIE